MGAVFAAAARAPITAIVIIFELTGDSSIILPLADAVARLTERGGGGALAVVTADGTLAHATPEIHADETLDAAVAALSRTDDAGLPVLGRFGGRDVVGWITHRGVLRAYQQAAERRPTTVG